MVEWSATRSERARIQRHGFFDYITNVKIIQVAAEVALDVLPSFQLDGEEPAMDLLPSLEHLKAHFAHSYSQHTSIRSAFEPLIAARQRAVRPLEISWANPRGFLNRFQLSTDVFG